MNATMCANLGLANPHQEFISNRPDIIVTIAVVLSVITAFTILANLIVIVALVRARFACFTSRVKNNNGKTQLLIISMAVSDVMLGGFIMPLGIYNIVKNRHWEIGSDLCNIREILDIVLSAVSLFHVVCMALDRYLAVCRPLLFRTLTMKTSLVMIGVCWIVPSLFMTAVVMGGWHQFGIEDVIYCSRFTLTCVFHHNKPFLFATVILLIDIPLGAAFVLYFFILREVVRYQRRTPRSFYYTGNHVQLKTKIKAQLFKTTSAFKLPKSEDNVTATSESIGKNKCVWELVQRIVTYSGHTRSRWSDSERSDRLNFPPGKLTISHAEQQETYFKAGLHHKRLSNLKTQTNANKTNNFEETTLLHARKTLANSITAREEPDSCQCLDKQSKNACPVRSSTRGLKMKAVTTIGIIVICFTVCWLPLNLAVFVATYKKFTNPVASLLVLWLAYINSCLNPIIYCCQRSTRRAIWLLMCPWRSH